MLRILTLAGYKVGFHRKVWSALAVYVFFFALIAGGMFALGTFPLAETEIPLTRFFERPRVWQNLAVLGRVGNYFLALVVIMIITSDFQTKMVRQHVVNGLSRDLIATGFALVAVLAAVLAMLALFAVGAVFSEPGAVFIDGQALKVLALFFLQSMGLFSFAVLLSVLARSGVAAILVFLGWTLVGEAILGVILNRQVHSGASQYLPFSVLSDIVPNPSLMPGAAPAPIDYGVVGMAVGYVLVFLALSWARLRTADL